MFRWTAEELRKVIEMLKRPEFDSKEIDPDLHKRMQQAVELKMVASSASNFRRDLLMETRT